MQNNFHCVCVNFANYLSFGDRSPLLVVPGDDSKLAKSNHTNKNAIELNCLPV